jgi:hypothetical protein
MSERVRVVLRNENVASAGVNLTFEKGMLKTPRLEVLSNPAKGDSYGIQLPLDPSDDEVPALQQLADAMQSAIEERGGA